MKLPNTFISQLFRSYLRLLSCRMKKEAGSKKSARRVGNIDSINYKWVDLGCVSSRTGQMKNIS